jgi:predicted exporter
MLSGRFNLYAYALPAVYLVSQGIVGIYILANRKKSTRYLVPLMTMGILGIIPYIIAVFKKLEVLWPSLSVGALSATIILLTVIVEHKAIGQELKRIFHI